MKRGEKIALAISTVIALGCIAANFVGNYINEHYWLGFLMGISITYLIVTLIEVAKRAGSNGSDSRRS